MNATRNNPDGSTTTITSDDILRALVGQTHFGGDAASEDDCRLWAAAYDDSKASPSSTDDNDEPEKPAGNEPEKPEKPAVSPRSPAPVKATK